MIIKLSDWFRKKKKEDPPEELTDIPEKFSNDNLIIESLLTTLRELDEKLNEHMEGSGSESEE